MRSEHSLDLLCLKVSYSQSELAILHRLSMETDEA